MNPLTPKGTSLRRTLRISLLALLASLGLVAAVASYWIAGAEADEFFDNQLRQIALYIWDTPDSYRSGVIAAPSHDPEDDFLIQVWDKNGSLLVSSNSAVAMPRGAATGYSDAEVAGINWRVYTEVEPERTVQVSQQLEVREETAAQASLNAVIPIALLIPLSWLVLNWIIGRIIGRLDRVAMDIAARDAESTEPIPTSATPVEILPLISAMNDLVLRLQAALHQQRRFVADAAHELRTPLAAITLQIDNLAATIGAEGRSAQRIADLKAGSARATALVSQLLKLARVESGATSPQSQVVALLPLIVECLERIAPLAEHKAIDLGLDQHAVPDIEGVEDEIRILIDNLLDNAIRYTPAGGTVDVILRDDAQAVILEVRDTGPGIPEAALPRVLERFYRASPADIEGSGLGLAIAKAAADRNHVALTLANRRDRSGLTAVLAFRRAARSKKVL
jgi:two-component system OmpR family sensor kinase/two-component system sensor histidine kinase QseC